MKIMKNTQAKPVLKDRLVKLSLEKSWVLRPHKSKIIVLPYFIEGSRFSEIVPLPHIKNLFVSSNFSEEGPIRVQYYNAFQTSCMMSQKLPLVGF